MKDNTIPSPYKLNIFIKLILVISSLNGCTGENALEKFEWLASDSAPQNYPMQIIQGEFVLKDGKKLYAPDGKTLHQGWGEGFSTHIVGDRLKALPTELNITFFSYTENQFYKDTIKLSYEKIIALFNEGFYSLKSSKQETYRRIVIGIAPGGSLSVWLAGFDKTIQVHYSKAQKSDISWEVINDNPTYSREAYIKLNLQETLNTEALDSLKKNGVPIDLWDRYQTQYHWQPRLITENRPPKLINKIQYVNGEIDYLFYPLEPAIAKITRAVPNNFYYSWKDPSGKALEHHFDFDEQEIVAAFEKLHAIKAATVDSPIYLNVTVAEHIEGRRIMITIQHEDEVITLLKTKIKQYASGYPADNPDAFYQD